MDSRHPLLQDQKHLPEGQCRYIMLHPEVKGLRCACVSFSLNRETPGSSCDCGHQACYHLPVREDRNAKQEQVEALKERVVELEEKLQAERNMDRRSLVLRISQLEELLDKYKTEMESEVRTVFRGMEGLWSSVGKLQRHADGYDDRLEALVDASLAVRDDLEFARTKLDSVDETSMHLEDRLDFVQGYRMRGRRHASSPPSPEPTSIVRESSHVLPKDVAMMASYGDAAATGSTPATSAKWSVHVSLLPKASQPMPFEQSTAAYRRCVSRGLHRMVTVQDRRSSSFTQAISKAFGELLSGREWMPLEARLCDAQTLAGLPMLKQLHTSKLNYQYDYDFLKTNCATLDASGNIDALYIALRNDSFTWSELRQSPPFVHGLEFSWKYDTVLDGPRADDDEQNCWLSADEAGFAEEIPSAGDILRAWSPPTSRLKRNASTMTRASSFGSADEDAKRSRNQQRRAANTSLDVLGRRIEAV